MNAFPKLFVQRVFLALIAPDTRERWGTEIHVRAPHNFDRVASMPEQTGDGRYVPTGLSDGCSRIDALTFRDADRRCPRECIAVKPPCGLFPRRISSVNTSGLPPFLQGLGYIGEL
jgi:hypothetical protein